MSFTNILDEGEFAALRAMDEDEEPQVITLTRGEIVATLRKRKRMTKGQLAKSTGLSRNYIRMIESGEADNLGERTLFALADALDIDACRLLRRPKNAD